MDVADVHRGYDWDAGSSCIVYYVCEVVHRRAHICNKTINRVRVESLRDDCIIAKHSSQT